jgi:hypothetical protein
VNPRALRFVFLAALAGGLVLWAQFRAPRDLQIDVDLTSALPGDVTEVDVIVRREGSALARHDERYGAAGAPALLTILVRARPGPAELDVTLVGAAGASRRLVVPVLLERDKPALVRLQP